MRLGIDLDGVLYDFSASLVRYLESTGDCEKYNFCAANRWSFYEDWGMTTEEFLDYCNKGADAGYVFCGPTREGAVEFMQRLYRQGFELHIITDRFFGSTPEVSHENTRRWLAENDIPYTSLTFSADKTVVPTDFFIEDKVENYEALLKTPTLPILINREWNRPWDDDRARVDTLAEFATIVETAKWYHEVVLSVV